MRSTSTLLHTLLSPMLLCLASCTGLGLRGGDYCVYETRTGAKIELARLVDELSTVDVLFLGEEHDNDAGHRLQLWTLEMLAESGRDLVISMEQFEADVQSPLDSYLAGTLDEKEFLRDSRPWSNYAEHYRPLIEFAKREGLPVIAANIPRRLAKRVAHEGLYSVGNERLVPWRVWTDEPAYAQRFAKAMGRAHYDENQGGLRRWFAAQCTKDEKMAESIAHTLDLAHARGEQPLLVHLCGKFHSDYYLGTVSRLHRRRPELNLRVVGMNSDRVLDRELDADERSQADYIWLVRTQG